MVINIITLTSSMSGIKQMFMFLIKLIIGLVVINYLFTEFNPIFVLTMAGVVWLSIVTFKWEYKD